MFSVDWDLYTWPTIGLDWLHTANLKTEGLLDIILAVAVVVPMIIAVWGFMSGGESGSEE